MKTIKFWSLMMVVSFVSVIAPAQTPPITLHLLDKAPALKPYRWLKGEPVVALKDNQMYLIEFTGLGCPGCQMAIPLLSKYADTYKRNLTIVSVYVTGHSGEDSTSMDYLTSLENYLALSGHKMKYSVSVDDPKGTMQRTWQLASGNHGIPTAYLIRDGVVIWMDHPLLLTSIFPKVMNDTFDPVATATLQKRLDQKFADTYLASIKSGNPAPIIQKIDSMIAGSPENLAYRLQKFQVLFSKDQDAALAYGELLLETTFKDSEPALWELARDITHTKVPLKDTVKMCELGIATTRRCLKISKFPEFKLIALELQVELYRLMRNDRMAIGVAESLIRWLDGNNESYAIDARKSWREYLTFYREHPKKQFSNQ